jgi:hypothetical protein
LTAPTNTSIAAASAGRSLTVAIRNTGEGAIKVVANVGVMSVRQQCAVSPNGQRFLMNKVLPDRGRTILLQNWLPQTVAVR